MRAHLLEDARHAPLVLHVTVDAIRDEPELLLALCNPADGKSHALWATTYSPLLTAAAAEHQAVAGAFRGALLRRLGAAVAQHGLGGETVPQLRAYALLLTAASSSPPREGKVAPSHAFLP